MLSRTGSLSKAQSLRSLWRWVWARWLDEDDKVLRVISWRTALIEAKYGQRRTVTCCWWIFD